MALAITSKGTAFEGDGTTLLSSLTITAGATVVVCTSHRTSASISSVVYNDGSDDYALTLRSSIDNANHAYVSIYSLDNAAGSAGSGSILGTLNISDALGFVVYQIAGAAAANAFDKQAAATGRSTTPNSGTSDVTFQDDEAVIGIFGSEDSITVNSWDGTCTDNIQSRSDSSRHIQAATKIITSAAACNIAATISTKNYWAACVATFKATGTAIKTVDGLAKASVKTVMGLAIANVKTIDGLA